MNITMVEPLHDDPLRMQHTYVCASCGRIATFKFFKKVVK